jgi:outer membrane immunogenic protein
MKLKLLIATAAVAVAAFPAQAQDTGGTGTFTGPRIQAQAGLDRVGLQVRDVRSFNGRGDFGGSQQDNEPSYGGEVGFDFDLGGFVVGAYAGADFSNAAEVFTTPRAVTLEADRNLYAGARVGIVLGDRAMVYGKGGLSRGNVDVTFGPGAVTTGFDDVDGERDGYHFGGGVEFALTQNFYIRGDYTHTEYDEINLGTLGVIGQTTSPQFEQRFNRNSITAAVGIRF